MQKMVDPNCPVRNAAAESLRIVFVVMAECIYFGYLKLENYAKKTKKKIVRIVK